jgi:hypothetical protein
MRLIPILRVSDLTPGFGIQADRLDIEHFRRKHLYPPFHPTSKVIPPHPHLLHPADTTHTCVHTETDMQTTNTLKTKKTPVNVNSKDSPRQQT